MITSSNFQSQILNNQKNINEKAMQVHLRENKNESQWFASGSHWPIYNLLQAQK